MDSLTPGISITVECPEDILGQVAGSLTKLHALIKTIEPIGQTFSVEAELPKTALEEFHKWKQSMSNELIRVTVGG